MNKNKRPAKQRFEERLIEKWQEAIESCVGLAPTQMSQLIKDSEHKTTEQNLRAGIAFALNMLGRDHLKRVNIKTEEEFARASEQLAEAKQKMPTAMRKAFKDLGRVLPRRGGPGRQPKLSPKEAHKVCDHISTFIRQGHSLKESLRLTANSSEILVGKKVGARTLQKAWDKRAS